VGIVAYALGAAACGHNGIRDEHVRAAAPVITDWIHGGIDHKHSCAAVKAAISPLPTNSSAYSTVNEDLAAYARKVC
jgi:hypothetical protein